MAEEGVWPAGIHSLQRSLKKRTVAPWGLLLLLLLLIQHTRMAPFLGVIANNLSIANLRCAEDVNEGLWNHDQDHDVDEEERRREETRGWESARLSSSFCFVSGFPSGRWGDHLSPNAQGGALHDGSGELRDILIPGLECRSSPERHPLDAQGT